MTDEETIKALESCCLARDNCCEDCPFSNRCHYNVEQIEKEALDIINRQKAEIESLNKLVIEKHKENNRLNDYLQYAEAEAVKKFAEKLKSVSQWLPLSALSDRFVTISDINNLLKERIGDTE